MTAEAVPARLRLYHFTCRHAASRIAKSGLLVPVPQKQLDPAGRLHLTWLTDLDTPDKDGLGLGSVRSPCDRTEVRFTCDVDPDDVARWPEAALALGFGVFHPARQLLEYGDRLPGNWWVSLAPVRVSGID